MGINALIKLALCIEEHIPGDTLRHQKDLENTNEVVISQRNQASVQFAFSQMSPVSQSHEFKLKIEVVPLIDKGHILI